MLTRHNQNGASLIEMMVALLVLAIGTLGIMAMQVTSLKVNKNAYLYSQAGILANDMFETMKATPEGQRASFTKRATASSACSDVTACSGAGALATWYNKQWYDSVEALLPEGDASIVESNGEYTITVSFTQSSLNDPDAASTVGGVPATEYVLKARFE